MYREALAEFFAKTQLNTLWQGESLFSPAHSLHAFENVAQRSLIFLAFNQIDSVTVEPSATDCCEYLCVKIYKAGFLLGIQQSILILPVVACETTHLIMRLIGAADLHKQQPVR